MRVTLFQYSRSRHDEFVTRSTDVVNKKSNNRIIGRNNGLLMHCAMPFLMDECVHMCKRKEIDCHYIIQCKDECSRNKNRKYCKSKK